MLLRNVVLFLVLSTSSTLFALDSNTTTNTIINEASKATQELQKAFEIELSETPEVNISKMHISKMNVSEMSISEVNTSKSKTSDINSSNIDVSKIDDSQITISEITDSNTTVSKINTSIETNETQVIPNKLMSIIQENNHSENNDSESNTILEQNIVEINTTDSNLSHYPSPSLIDPLEVDQNLSLQEDPNLQEITVLEINQTNTTTLMELTVPIDQNTTEQNLTETISCEDKESNTTQACQEEVVEGKMINGLIIYKTRIKPFCDMTGEEFAKQYAQEDWDDIYHDKEFAQEVFKACPRVEKRYKTKWTPDLYEFTLEYASDSEAIPEC